MVDNIPQSKRTQSGTPCIIDDASLGTMKIKAEPLEEEEEEDSGTTSRLNGHSLVVMRGKDFTVELNPDYYDSETDEACEEGSDTDVDSKPFATSTLAQLSSLSSDTLPRTGGADREVRVKSEKLGSSKEVEKKDGNVPLGSRLSQPIPIQPKIAMQRTPAATATNNVQSACMPFLLPAFGAAAPAVVSGTVGIGVGSPVIVVVQPNLSGISCMQVRPQLMAVNAVTSPLPTGLNLVRPCSQVVSSDSLVAVNVLGGTALGAAATAPQASVSGGDSCRREESKTCAESVQKGQACLLPSESGKSSCQDKESKTCTELEDDIRKKHECTECGKKFRFKQNMRTHYNAIHLQELKYSCTECGREFRYAKTCKGHMDSVHRGIRRHACEECGKSFLEKSSRDVHVATVHRKERKFSCVQCGTKFSQKSRLTAHMNFIHLGITRYSCPECGQGFYRKCDVNGHMKRRHTNTVKAAV